MRPLRNIAAGALAVACAALAVPGFAAGLGLVSERLTSVSGPTSVPTTVCTPAAAADAGIDGVVSLGTATSLTVRSWELGNGRALVRFDLGACGVPADADVRSAQLRLVLATAPPSARVHAVHRVTAVWTETIVTSLAQPSVATTATATAATGTTDGVAVTWDVTVDARAFAAGTAANHGWRVSDHVEDAPAPVQGTYWSRERATAAERPSLTVEYYP